MNCVITNGKQYIRLDNGTPVTCCESARDVFTQEKARNIHKNLPKSLHKFHFRVMPIGTPEIIPSINQAIIKSVSEEKKVISTSTEISDEITRWLNKINNYNGLLDDARNRQQELFKELSNIDKARSNKEHEIELSDKVSASAGYKMYRDLKEILLKRRKIKDEIMIINMMLQSDMSCVSKDKINRCAQGLTTRKFAYREEE